MTKQYNKVEIYKFLFLPIIFVLFTLLMSEPLLYQRFIILNTTTTNLINDTIGRHGLDAALLNAALVSFLNIGLFLYLKFKPTGFLIATFYTVLGFCFLGMTLTNLLPLYLGAVVYSKYKKVPLETPLLIAMLTGTLGPIVSQIMFGYGDPTIVSVLLGIVAGVFIGFIIVPFGSHVSQFHEGLNLYNIGFVSGFLAIIYHAFSTGFGYPIAMENHLILETSIYTYAFLILSILYFLVLAFYKPTGSILNNHKKIHLSSGQAPSDFCEIGGFHATYLNMAFIGTIVILIPVIFKTPLNGLTLSAIYCVIAFGGFGKHSKNIVPVFIGAILAAFIAQRDLQTSQAMASVLFASTLGPITGVYGPFWGMVAGFFHFFVSSLTAPFHGGLNLYNNGLAGGIVAGFLIVLIQTLKKPD